MSDYIEIDGLNENTEISQDDRIIIRQADKDRKVSMGEVKEFVYPPEASNTATGLVNQEAQAFSGQKTFSGGIATPTLLATKATITDIATVQGDLHVNGNIIQQGETYETNVETLKIKDQLLVTRDGATTGLASDEVTGIKATKYDGENDGLLVFGSDGVARVGDEGDTQPLATREEEPLNNSLQIWDEEKKLLKSLPYGEPGHFLKQGENGLEFDKVPTQQYYRENIITNSTRMIAHRGVSAIAPENTLPAYELAGDYGFWGGETDIQKTKDGVFVCIHDGTLDRTTNGTGNISDYTLAEIRELVIDKQSYYMGNTRDDCILNGEAAVIVPTLEEYLEVCKNKHLVPVIELKEETLTAADMPALLEILDKWQMTDQVVFIAFNEQNTNLLEALHGLNFRIHCQPIIDFTEENIDYVAEKFKPNCGIDVNYQQVTKELIEYAHSKGVEVNCWTVDDETVKERLMSYGIDYISTNKLVNSNLPEMKTGALDYELGGFNRTVEALQTLFKNQNKTISKVYCQNPEIGPHNCYAEKTPSTEGTPYSRAILSNETETYSELKSRAIDKTKYYVKEKTVYVGGGDFNTYKVTLLPFNERGLNIGDLMWCTKDSYLDLPEETCFVLFYFARVDKGDFSETDIQNLKNFYFGKKRQFIKLDNPNYVTKFSTNAGDSDLQIRDIYASLSDDPTYRCLFLTGVNTKGFSKCKIHSTSSNYKITIYGLKRGRYNRLVLTKDIGWQENNKEIVLETGAEIIHFAAKRTDDSVITYANLIELMNSVLIEIY